MQNSADLKNLVIAFALSVAIMFGWQFFFPHPKPAVTTATETVAAKNEASPVPVKIDEAASREQALEEMPRITIDNGKLQGSLPVGGAGLRIDDLTLTRYREEIDPKSPAVMLLSPAGTEKRYQADFGWNIDSGKVTLPDAKSVWQQTGDKLTAGGKIELKWKSPEGVVFTNTITLDENYMFTITRRVENMSGGAIKLSPYADLNREWQQHGKYTYVSHEGPMGVFNNELEEMPYKDIKEKKEKDLTSTASGWLGIGDKYWMTAIIPSSDNFDARYSYYQKDGQDRYQVDYQAKPVEIAAGAANEISERFYAGPKEVKLLDSYAAEYHIPLFDRAVDFGMLYFLTRPIFTMLQYLFSLTGNFGISILMLTVVVRALMYPLANKSYESMAHMRDLQPQMADLKKRYGEDRMRMQQEMMELYRREKVNPMAGCLPILVQIPVFFSLYKVLYVTIEMRHTPFFGWIHDLSAPDPTSVLNLFGLLSWAPPSFLIIGIWPIIMTATMVIQQKLHPAPADPVQATMMKAMPYMFLFLFASFPAGLVIYWSWSNTLSIIQQWIIINQHKKKMAKRAAKKKK